MKEELRLGLGLGLDLAYLVCAELDHAAVALATLLAVVNLKHHWILDLHLCCMMWKC